MVESGIDEGDSEVRAESESDADATVVVVVVVVVVAVVVVVEVAVALLRLVVPRCFLPAGPVASVLALALTLTADLALALAFDILAVVVAGMAVRRETPDSDGGGGDPIVAVVEKVLLSDEDPTWTVVITSLLKVVPAVAEAVAALWTAERASENADCSVATLRSAFSGGGPPMSAIAPHLRRGGGRGMEVVVLVDPMVAMVDVLLRPVRAGADDGGLAASARGA